MLGLHHRHSPPAPIDAGITQSLADSRWACIHSTTAHNAPHHQPTTVHSPIQHPLPPPATTLSPSPPVPHPTTAMSAAPPAAAATAAVANKKTPSAFLQSILGRPVLVKLNSGVCYRGVLACLDGYMNVAMEQTEEWVEGELKGKYGDCFLRGNNILYISAQKRKGGGAAVR